MIKTIPCPRIELGTLRSFHIWVSIASEKNQCYQKVSLFSTQHPTWSNGQDTRLSPERPGFNSRRGRPLFNISKINLVWHVYDSCQKVPRVLCNSNGASSCLQSETGYSPLLFPELVLHCFHIKYCKWGIKFMLMNWENSC